MLFPDNLVTTLSTFLHIPVSRDIEHMQLGGLRQLWRYPRQSVFSYTEDIQAATAPDLGDRRDIMVRLHFSHSNRDPVKHENIV